MHVAGAARQLKLDPSVREFSLLWSSLKLFSSLSTLLYDKMQYIIYNLETYSDGEHDFTYTYMAMSFKQIPRVQESLRACASQYAGTHTS